MRECMRWWSCVFVAVVSIGAGRIGASVGPQVTIEQRARGAERIVVASIADIRAGYERNQYGDELIVTHAKLTIEEAIKGGTEPATVAVDGGTVNGMTLRVSNLPMLNRGERAVFFLARGTNGEFRPHLNGLGILKLDSTNHVRGSSLSLDDIRQMAHASGR